MPAPRVNSFGLHFATFWFPDRELPLPKIVFSDAPDMVVTLRRNMDDLDCFLVGQLPAGYVIRENENNRNLSLALGTEGEPELRALIGLSHSSPALCYELDRPACRSPDSLQHSAFSRARLA
jgi:hypothetical protein